MNENLVSVQIKLEVRGKGFLEDLTHIFDFDMDDCALEQTKQAIASGRQDALPSAFMTHFAKSVETCLSQSKAKYPDLEFTGNAGFDFINI